MLIPVVLLAALAIGAITLFKQAHDAAHHSCLASVKVSVKTIVGTNGVIITNLPPVGGHRILSPEEALPIFQLANRRFDCVRFRRTDELVPFDLWGRHFYVLVERTAYGIHATAFSAGPDGRPGTSDDLF